MVYGLAESTQPPLQPVPVHIDDHKKYLSVCLSKVGNPLGMATAQGYHGLPVAWFPSDFLGAVIADSKQIEFLLRNFM